MSSSVYQGLQSCLELRVVEPRLVRLKLDPSKANFEPEPTSNNEERDAITRDNNINDIDTGGWSFIKFGNANESTRNDNVYVHPLVKRSASMLTDKSLEMCTENLGSETGSEVSHQSIDELSLESGAYDYIPSRESSARRKHSCVERFPPPLTSISGSNGVKVKSHREDGRLVLQAVSITPCHRYFHADRSEGRVRLSIFNDATTINDEDDEEEERDEVVENDDENGEVVDEVEEESVMRDVRIWKEIVGILGVKSRQGIWLGKGDAKKVGTLCPNICLIGSNCWWRDYIKAKTWKVSLNLRENHYHWIPY